MQLDADASIDGIPQQSPEGATMRNLEYLWKDDGSGGGGCPALYRAEGGYVVQGIKLTDTERAQLRQLADHEDGVYVPANVLDKLRQLSP